MKNILSHFQKIKFFAYQNIWGFENRNYLCIPFRKERDNKMGAQLSWFRASALQAEGRGFESLSSHISLSANWGFIVLCHATFTYYILLSSISFMWAILARIQLKESENTSTIISDLLQKLRIGNWYTLRNTMIKKRHFQEKDR